MIYPYLHSVMPLTPNLLVLTTMLVAGCLLVCLTPIAWADNELAAPATPAQPADTHPAKSPPDQAAPSTLSRAELAGVLVDWFTLPKLPYSLFAVYRDVPTTHTHYVAIDAARRQHLLLPTESGYFLPEAPATQRDAWLALAKLLFPQPSLSEEEVAQLLAPLTGVDDLPRYERIRVARLVSAKLLGQPPYTHLQPDAPLQADWLNNTLAQLDTNRAFIRRQEMQTAENNNPIIPLPANLLLALTPSQAISSDDIQLGSYYYFQLLEPLQLADGEVVPKDSSTRGTVVAVDEEHHEYTLSFDKMTSSQTGQRYQYQAEAVLQLLPRSKLSVLSTKPERENKSLLITGSRVEVLTQRLPSPTQPPIKGDADETQADETEATATPTMPNTLTPPNDEATHTLNEPTQP